MPQVIVSAEAVTLETLQGASGVVLVCDTTNAASLSPLKAVAKLLPAHMPCVAVGTKSDEVSKRKITQEDIKVCGLGVSSKHQSYGSWQLVRIYDVPPVPSR